MGLVTESELLALLSASSEGRIRHFQNGQWPAIETVLAQGGGTTLLVERTGWGKSLVYFAATLALRQHGRGPSLLIAPLLSLMRDQVLAAARLGLKAATINSANREDWDGIADALLADEIDLLLISPERLASFDFMASVLGPLMERLGLFVIDEAHCLSDWGHDFRPDYLRIRRLLSRLLPPGTPVLATTATASARVVEDLTSELGPCRIIRGPLARNSLDLQVVRAPAPAHRYAWLLERLPDLPGSGIVYAATRRECERLAAWLQAHDINASAYHAGLETDRRVHLEEKLRRGGVKALVATGALGMGFDKPDLSFVVHHEAPLSPAHYYQQAGRAGRTLDHAFGILLGGEGDEAIARALIARSVPSERERRDVLDMIEESETGIGTADLAQALGRSEAEVEAIARLMAAEETTPVAFSKGLWRPTLSPWRENDDRMRSATGQRIKEWERMKDYARTSDCLMRFLARELDDENAAPCGHCANCLGHPLLNPRPSRAGVRKAAEWLTTHGGAGRGTIGKEPPPAWVAAMKALFRMR